uniref:Transcription factor Elf N-terminal domain-containing protein n=1 Tax=Sphaeramia orbicularis TaxID=375764 RepID=A0A672YIE6_9TELE
MVTPSNRSALVVVTQSNPSVEAVIVSTGEVEEGVVLQEESCPAVIVEEVPNPQVEECYSAQVLVYDDETYLMQDVAEEQEVVTEVADTGESAHFILYV